MIFKIWKNTLSNATFMSNNAEQPLSLWSQDSSANNGRDDISSEAARQVLIVDDQIWSVGCSQSNEPIFCNRNQEISNIIVFGEFKTINLWELPEGMRLSTAQKYQNQAVDLYEYFQEHIYPLYEN